MLPALATNRSAVGASSRPAPPEEAGCLVTATGGLLHEDTREESVVWRAGKAQPASVSAIIRQLKVFLVMFLLFHPFIWPPLACK
jgi:hypothetical protein